MKSKYTKPQIMFEDFSLSVSIANCEVTTSLHYRGTCGLKYAWYTLFDSSLGDVCNRDFSSVSTPYDDSLCYHNPSESYNLFSS